MKLDRTFTLILNVFILNGCFAYRFSSPLLPLQEDQNAKAIFQDLVLLAAEPRSYELTKFIDALQKAALFKQVGNVDELHGTPDLILDSWSHEREGDPFRNCWLGLEGQMLTIGSAGLIPQICKDPHKVSFDLYSPKSKKKVSVTFHYETGSALGWAALFYNLK